MSQVSSAAEPAVAPLKPRRNPISCESCRSRKTKCLGGPPPCQVCARLNLTCEFRGRARPERRKRKEVAGLAKAEAREEDMDELLAQGNEHENIAIAGSCVASEEFMGKSSIGALLNGINTGKASSGGDGQSPDSATRVAARPARLVVREEDLPARHFADELVANYFTFFGCIFPFIDKDDFERSYEEAWRETRVHRPLERAIINLVFALGTQFCHLDKNHPETEVFFARASKLIRPFIFGACQLSLVQALILVSFHFQTTDNPTLCWNSVGQAVRLAQGLGLHLDTPAAKTAVGSRSDEIRRRVWSTCVILDRMVATTWGRPTMVDDRLGHLGRFANPLPEATEAFPAVPAVSEVDAFNELITLYAIADDARAKLYPAFADPSESPGMVSPSLIPLQHRLSQWTASLPPTLKQYQPALWSSPVQQTELTQHKSVFLRVLSLLYVILVHRSAVDTVRHTETPLTPESLEDCNTQVILSSARACATACVEVVELATINKTATFHRGWWWFDTCALFTSVSVLLALDTAPAQSWARQAQVMTDRNRTALENGFKLFDQYRHRGRNIEVSFWALNCIRESHNGVTGADPILFPPHFFDYSTINTTLSDTDIMQSLLDLEGPGDELRAILDDSWKDSSSSSLFFGSASNWHMGGTPFTF